MPVAAVAAFVPLMLVTTLLHLDKFHLSGPDLNAVVAGWAWLIVYAIVPFAVAGLAVLLYTLFHPGVRQTARQLEEEDDSSVWPKPRPAAGVGPGPV